MNEKKRALSYHVSVAVGCMAVLAILFAGIAYWSSDNSSASLRSDEHSTERNIEESAREVPEDREPRQSNLMKDPLYNAVLATTKSLNQTYPGCLYYAQALLQMATPNANVPYEVRQMQLEKMLAKVPAICVQ